MEGTDLATQLARDKKLKINTLHVYGRSMRVGELRMLVYI